MAKAEKPTEMPWEPLDLDLPDSEVKKLEESAKKMLGKSKPETNTE